MSKPKPEEPSSEPVLYEIAFDPALYIRLEEHAVMYGVDMEGVIITAIEEYLENAET
jgi:hypothetical protein